MIYAKMMDWLAEFIGWNLSVGIYRCRVARGGLNFKIYGFALARCAAVEILSRICRRGAVMGGRALVLCT